MYPPVFRVDCLYICSVFDFFGEHVKNRSFLYLALSFAVFCFFACGFDSDGESQSVNSWLSSQGMPSSYKVNVLEISDLPIVSSEVFHSSKPMSGYVTLSLGKFEDISHDSYLDFGFNFTKGDTAFIRRFKKDDSSEVALRLFPEKGFYASKFLKDSLPLEEDLEVNISWILKEYSTSSELNKVLDIPDSTWYASFEKWKTKNSFDTTYSISIKKDSAVFLAMPKELVDAMREVSFGARLQVKVSAEKASRVYRFSGHGNASYMPSLQLKSEDRSMLLTPFRSALTMNGESLGENTLYGGTRDSLVLEISGEKIMEALSEFYGDEFPWKKGNKMDVRQAVVLAQFTIPTNDAGSVSELGAPIQVVVSSFAEEDTTEYRRDELYKLNISEIASNGHPNLVFYDRDSISLQVTYGMRDFINKAAEMENLKVMLRLGYPVLAPKDTIYNDYINAKGDTIRFFFDYFDYAKYDFAPMLENGVQMKLWLASKRGDEE